MEQGKDSLLIINPVILEKSKEKFEVWDSCFSADVAFFCKTLRHKQIKVEFINEKGQTETRQFENDLSELFQHEIDHLDGILFTDRVISNQIMMRTEWEKIF